jgi:organic hydroperoxide reductase OsmC/OhrA
VRLARPSQSPATLASSEPSSKASLRCAVRLTPPSMATPRSIIPKDLLMTALSACHMLSYLAVCAHAGIVVLSYEDSMVGTVARRDGKVKFVDVLLRPKVTLEEGGDIERAKALHEKAHNICVVANSMNFPVHYEAEVVSAGGSVAAA